MVDKDGQFSYGPVKTINKGRSSEMVKLYPTILRKGDALQLQVLTFGNDRMTYTVFDDLGRKLSAGSISNTNSSNFSFINTRNLATGRYILQIAQASKKQSIQFIIQ